MKIIIGPRIIKTGIAVTITMFIAEKFNWEPAVFGAVSAIINMQPSIYLTFKTARTQILIHFLGVLTGIIIGYLFGAHPLSVGLAVILMILLYSYLKLEASITMGVVAAIFILGSSTDQFFQHAFSRSLVIFTGLTVAMCVNVLLWPPKYKDQFIHKLRQSNLEAVNYFCQAINDFTDLEYQEPLNQEDNPQRKVVLTLISDADKLAEHFRRETRAISLSATDLTNEHYFYVVERVLTYNRTIMAKANHIYGLIPARRERRSKLDAPTITKEFQEILDILKEGCPTIVRVNDKLRGMVLENHKGELEVIDEIYWERLTAAVEEWQQRITNNYYIHALIEVSVVANEVRWVAQEGKKIINSLDAGERVQGLGS